MSMDRKRINKISKKREQSLAKEIDGKRHAKSGAVWWDKGDASSVDFLVEDKFTTDTAYTLSASVLNKLEQQSRKVNKLPILRFGFYGRSSYAVLREKDINYSGRVELTQSFDKSHKFYLKDLELCFLYVAHCDHMHISFSGKTYFILEWKRFLEIKDKIVKGEMI